MRILSYRGPSDPGGVASTVSQIFDMDHDLNEWWFLRNREIHVKSRKSERVTYSLNRALLESHYRFCNAFLWPVLHDMPERAEFDENEYKAYHALNSTLAFQLRVAQKLSSSNCFVNDYQLALLPELVRKTINTTIFWHIPWPKKVREDHLQPMIEIARSLLCSSVIGFHTPEYLCNFQSFVAEHMKELLLNISPRSILVAEREGSVRRVRTLVLPLGVDPRHWQGLSRALESKAENANEVPYLLSVDRCDYTKGISERLEAIDKLFIRHPELKKRIRFVQVCTRSRSGLNAFDEYWKHCKNLASNINVKHGSSEFTPLTWIEESQSPSTIASLYANAEAMLITSLRDGLNLTAKEYLASRHRKPGLLILSDGAGVSSEIGKNSLLFSLQDSESVLNAILKSLEIEDDKRAILLHAARNNIQSNTLQGWWHQLTYESKRERLFDLARKQAAGI